MSDAAQDNQQIWNKMNMTATLHFVVSLARWNRSQTRGWSSYLSEFHGQNS